MRVIDDCLTAPNSLTNVEPKQQKIHFKLNCSSSAIHYAAKCGLLFEGSRSAQTISPNQSSCEACSFIFHLLLTNGRGVLSLSLPTVNLVYVTKTQEH